MHGFGFLAPLRGLQPLAPKADKSRRQVRPVIMLLLGHSATRKRAEGWIVPGRRGELEVGDFRLCRVLHRNLVGHRLLDSHDVRFADIAKPFPIPYIREIYAEIISLLS